MIDLDPEVDSDYCQNCGEPVSRKFALSHGDNDDIAHRCPECDIWRRISRGSAAGIDLPGHPDPEVVGGHHGNEALADGGHDRGQSNVGTLVFAIVATILFSIPIIMVVSAA